MHGPGGWRANGASKMRTQQLFDAVLDQWLACFTKQSRSWPMRTKWGDQQYIEGECLFDAVIEFRASSL